MQNNFGPYDAESQDIDQRRKYAELLRQQGMTPLQAQTVGGMTARISPLEGLAKMLNAYSGSKGVEMAGQERKDLMGRMETERSTDMAKLLQAYGGTPARPQVMGADDKAMIADQGGEANPIVPAIPGDPNLAAQMAMQSRLPDVKAYALPLMNIGETRVNREEDRTFRAEQAKSQREFQMEQMRLRAEDQRLSQQERLAAAERLKQMQIDFQREMARDRAANKPEKMVTIMGPEGEPVSMPQSQAAGMTPYTPSAAKAAKEAKAREGAKQQLSDTVAQLRTYYDDLKAGGGIVSQDQGAIGNVASRIQSSGIGQATGGALGTKNQEARQKIEQTRPLLLNLIKTATGMSAQQMNSNAEMQLYLRAATDPTLSYEANVEALNNLDKLFGLGLGVTGRGATGDFSGAPKRRASDSEPPAGAVREKK